MEFITNGFLFDSFNEWMLKINNEVYNLDDCFLIDNDLISVATTFTGGKSILMGDVAKIKTRSFPQYLHLSLDDVSHDFYQMLFSISLYKKDKILCVNVSWGANFLTWRESHNLVLYKESFKNNLINFEMQYLVNIYDAVKDDDYYSDSVDIKMEFEFLLDDFDTLDEIFKYLNSELLKVEKQTEEELVVDGWSNKIVSKFNFPEEYQVYCMKYLQYFVEFLKDMEISAQSTLKTENGQTIFCVTPNDDVSLVEIHNALGLYLSLPQTTDSLPQNMSNDSFTQLKIEKLNFEISSLKNSLRLQDAMIMCYESKSLPPVRGGSVIHRSLEHVISNGKKEESAEFFDGIVKLGIYKIGPLELNFGKLATKFKNMSYKY